MNVTKTSCLVLLLLLSACAGQTEIHETANLTAFIVHQYRIGIDSFIASQNTLNQKDESDIQAWQSYQRDHENETQNILTRWQLDKNTSALNAYNILTSSTSDAILANDIALKTFQSPVAQKLTRPDTTNYDATVKALTAIGSDASAIDRAKFTIGYGNDVANLYKAGMDNAKNSADAAKATPPKSQ